MSKCKRGFSNICCLLQKAPSGEGGSRSFSAPLEEGTPWLLVFIPLRADWTLLFALITVVCHTMWHHCISMRRAFWKTFVVTQWGGTLYPVSAPSQASCPGSCSLIASSLVPASFSCILSHAPGFHWVSFPLSHLIYKEVITLSTGKRTWSLNWFCLVFLCLVPVGSCWDPLWMTELI